jgi:hypothetical protein
VTAVVQCPNTRLSEYTQMMLNPLNIVIRIHHALKRSLNLYTKTDRTCRHCNICKHHKGSDVKNIGKIIQTAICLKTGIVYSHGGICAELTDICSRTCTNNENITGILCRNDPSCRSTPDHSITLTSTV